MNQLYLLFWSQPASALGQLEVIEMPPVSGKDTTIYCGLHVLKILNGGIVCFN